MLDGLLCRRPCVDIGRMPCQRLWARRPGSVHFRPGQRCWRLSPCPGPVRRPDSCSRRVGRSGKVHWLEKYPKARHRTAFSKLWGARGCSRFKAMPHFLFDPKGRARVIPNLRQPRLTRFINDLVGRLSWMYHQLEKYPSPAQHPDLCLGSVLPLGAETGCLSA